MIYCNMEMEITIFKFVNEYLKRSGKSVKILLSYIFLILLFLLFTAFFIYANVAIIPNNHYIS